MIVVRFQQIYARFAVMDILWREKAAEVADTFWGASTTQNASTFNGQVLQGNTSDEQSLYLRSLVLSHVEALLCLQPQPKGQNWV
jgi:hypothetical protein